MTTKCLLPLLFVGVVGALAIAPTSASAALIDCTTTPLTVNAATGSKTLNPTDIVRSTSGTGSCVQLRDGKSLNLNGARIECVNTSGRCADAVEAFAAGSILEGGTITGDFETGAVNVQTVRNVTLDGSAQGIQMGSLGRTVSGNVIKNVWNGITMGSAATVNYYVHDNFLDTGVVHWQTGTYGFAIDGTGTTGLGPRIEHNLVRNFSGGGIHVSAYGSGSNIRITGSILSNIAGTVIETSGATPTLSGNLCDDASVCPDSTPPFVLP